MTDSKHDVAIVGGGLAGGLIALALHRHAPDVSFVLIEGGKTIGGNHRWSWFSSDLDAAGKELLSSVHKTEWNDGYEVEFPRYKRVLNTDYQSMASSDFHDAISDLLPEGSVMLDTKAKGIEADGVELDDGTRITARAVVDCRSFRPSRHLRGAWQVFLGRHFKLDHDHGIERPVIMDANVDQLAPHGNGGAYRFVYVLPLADDEVFVEDTYYADDFKMDREGLSARIDQYCHDNGWKDGAEIGVESGALPVLTGGNFKAYQEEVRIPGVAIAGARGGFTHPLTSYTMAIAVENALVIARNAHLPGKQLAELMEQRARKYWRSTGYYRLLNRFLFFAADPEKRVNVLQRFYGLRQGLIERFYAAHSTTFDRVRVLWGNPPVAIHRAITAAFKRGEVMKKSARTEKTV
ncbi:MAG: lycopene beta-cyclase CrtY [Pseudomonadota bacterium]